MASTYITSVLSYVASALQVQSAVSVIVMAAVNAGSPLSDT